MDIGGRASQGVSRTLSPLTSPLLGPAASGPPPGSSPLPYGSQAPVSPSTRQARASSPAERGAAARGHNPHAAGQDPRRQLAMSTPGSRRLAAPLRSATSATRAALQQSMRADGKCYAFCMADRLDLEGLADNLSNSPDASQAAAELPRGGTDGAASFLEKAEAAEAGLAKDAAEAVHAPSGIKLWGSKAVRGPLRKLRGWMSSVTMGWIPPASVEADVSPASASSRPAVTNGAGHSASVGSRSDLGCLSGAELVRVFGVGESMVLHIKLFRGKDLFAFRFGAVVCWGLAGKEREALPKQLRAFAVRALTESEVDEESMEYVIQRREGDEEEEEDMDTQQDDEAVGNNCIKQDQIILATNSPFERLAHAYALAQSVRLGVFEVVVDRSIAQTRSIPETMANTGDVMLDARELTKQIGGLLMLRCDVNLHTDILDTPDIFWDEERFEPHYVACRVYLDIDKRVDILNQRLGVLKDLYDLLQNTLNVKHGNYLEWIIIILILFEVLLEFLELIHDAWTS